MALCQISVTQEPFTSWPLVSKITILIHDLEMSWLYMKTSPLSLSSSVAIYPCILLSLKWHKCLSLLGGYRKTCHSWPTVYPLQLYPHAEWGPVDQWSQPCFCVRTLAWRLHSSTRIKTPRSNIIEIQGARWILKDFGLWIPPIVTFLQVHFTLSTPILEYI